MTEGRGRVRNLLGVSSTGRKRLQRQRGTEAVNERIRMFYFKNKTQTKAGQTGGEVADKGLSR